MSRWTTEKQIQNDTTGLINDGYIGWIEKREKQPVLIITGRNKK